MGTYGKGEHVKIEVGDRSSGDREWLWLLVDDCDDGQRLVFGRLDSEPIAITDMYLGQELAVSYDNTRERRKFA